ncbi:hypothetical protein [Nocardioides speluncae]|uniref:hypothetical protein n=1 Tax=Nocardioides speluncae TaxID=2670337 RepID=UPI000D69950E|nr:hypothetical protein [Nocardioides speluncae]
MSRSAAVAVAAVLVLAGCGAPDYGGYDSDADDWPQADPISYTQQPDAQQQPQGSRLPLSLAGEPLDPGAESAKWFSGTTRGLTRDTGLYARSGGPFGVALMVYTGKPAAIDTMDSFYRGGRVTSVGRSACGTYPGRPDAPFCWRSARRQLVTVIGVGQPTEQQLARAVDEAWTYLERNS